MGNVIVDDVRKLFAGRNAELASRAIKAGVKSLKAILGAQSTRLGLTGSEVKNICFIIDAIEPVLTITVKSYLGKDTAVDIKFLVKDVLANKQLQFAKIMNIDNSQKTLECIASVIKFAVNAAFSVKDGVKALTYGALPIVGQTAMCLAMSYIVFDLVSDAYSAYGACKDIIAEAKDSLFDMVDSSRDRASYITLEESMRNVMVAISNYSGVQLRSGSLV